MAGLFDFGDGLPFGNIAGIRVQPAPMPQPQPPTQPGGLFGDPTAAMLLGSTLMAAGAPSLDPGHFGRTMATLGPNMMQHQQNMRANERADAELAMKQAAAQRMRDRNARIMEMLTPTAATPPPVAQPGIPPGAAAPVPPVAVQPMPGAEGDVPSRPAVPSVVQPPAQPQPAAPAMSPLEQGLGGPLTEGERLSIALAEDKAAAIEDVRKARRDAKKTQFTQAGSLRDDYRTETKDLRDAVLAGRQAVNAPATIGGDTNLIYSLFQVLEPGGRVTGGEVELTSMGMPAPLAAAISTFQNRITAWQDAGGQGPAPALLPSWARDSIKDELGRLLKSRETQYKDATSRYRSMAESQGLDPSLIINPLPPVRGKQPPINRDAVNSIVNTHKAGG